MSAPRGDPFDPPARSRVMRAVKSSGTTPELAVRAALRSLGRGYRLGGWGLPGRPDLVLPGRGVALFVHGCFWHAHACPRGARKPKANADYWRAKIAGNQARDARVRDALALAGWRVETVWECETRDPQALRERLDTLLSQ